MKKLRKRVRAIKLVGTVQRYKDCSAIGEAACIYECRNLGVGTKGMANSRTSKQAQVRT